MIRAEVMGDRLKLTVGVAGEAVASWWRPLRTDDRRDLTVRHRGNDWVPAT